MGTVVKRIKNRGRNVRTGPQAQAPSIVANGTVFTGEVKLSEDLRIDGAVLGDICSTKAVVIGPGGEVRGNISAAFLDIYGLLDGNAGITGHTFLRKGGILLGDLETAELEIEDGARFEGQRVMTRKGPGGAGRLKGWPYRSG
ncbi:bactofilin family protein [Dysgonomonas termitidis]|uniref:Polymer-forming cytoskeletal protein n=1 Tax=Dysgonomonas termitidis TaxID=1516126 RepID=A0ABV9L1A0_9BACT